MSREAAGSGEMQTGTGTLREGYTTGSCAAAAAKAATVMLLTGRDIHEVSLVTPSGRTLLLAAEEIRRGKTGEEDFVSCGVRKDAGDDPDVTDGLLVVARVSFLSEGDGSTDNAKAAASPTDGGAGEGALPPVLIDGGEGVGRVTKPGLDQPVGNAAINSTPRRMIAEAVRSAWRETVAQGACEGGVAQLSGKGFFVRISIPGGEAVAEKTFNPKLGITGGLSVLGTSGIVVPMSDEALRDTIRIEIRQKKALGYPVLAAAPGNYGRDFFHAAYGFSLDTCVTSSNFIRDCVEMASEAGVEKMLFTGHIGKLVKVAGGIGNTHSRYGDHRMEILARLTAECHPDAMTATLREALLSCVSTDEAVRVLREEQLAEDVMSLMTERIAAQLNAWAKGRPRVEVIVFSNVYGTLGESDGARAYTELLKSAQKEA